MTCAGSVSGVGIVGSVDSGEPAGKRGPPIVVSRWDAGWALIAAPTGVVVAVVVTTAAITSPATIDGNRPRNPRTERLTARAERLC